MVRVTKTIDRWLERSTPLPVVLLAVALLILIGFLDFVTSVEVIFGFFYLVPICLIAWKFGVRPGLAMAFAAALTWSLLDALEHPELSFGTILWNIAMQCGVFSVVAATMASLQTLSSERARTNAELEKALEEVNRLSGMLPICAWCKKIRDDDGTWHVLEEYLQSHSEADFTHSICPDCMQREMGGRRVHGGNTGGS